MSYHNKHLSIGTPRKALKNLMSHIIPELVLPDAELELSITADNTNINIREFIAYLDFFDHTYGRLCSHNLRSYAQKKILSW